MPIARLLVIVEGQTEETFVNESLTPYLARNGYDSVAARILGNARQRARRGGIRPWAGVRHELLRHLREDAGCIVTTMFDYYGLPGSGDGPWSGVPYQIEESMAQEIREELGSGFREHRFVPFIVRHEFEGLLFSDCGAFARGAGVPNARVVEERLRSIREVFDTPEDINDSPETHPSARIQEVIPGYEKPLQGNLAALEIGVDRMIRECPRFSRWIQRLVDVGAVQRSLQS